MTLLKALGQPIEQRRNIQSMMPMRLPKIYAKGVKKKPIDLSLSENPLGCSPLVIKTLRKITMKDISRYPNTEKLIKKISKRFKVTKEEIILGDGSEQLVKLIAQTFLQKNDIVLVQRGSFPLFNKECLLARAKVKFFQPDKLTDTNKTKMIFICNPNNPTGEVFDPIVIENIINRANNSIVVIDEAIGEFINNTFIPKAVKSNNCIILKTFSKAFGLAGLRIGFAIGSKSLIQKLANTQQAFPVSSLSCKLAEVAIDDKDFVDRTVKFITKERNFLLKELKKRGFIVSNSSTNNIFIQSKRAFIVINKLNRLGVSVVSGTDFPGIKMPGFRISIKDRKTNRLFLKKLDEITSRKRTKH